MDVDERRIDDRPGELKIKGQAAAERKRGRRDEEDKVNLTASLWVAGTHNQAIVGYA